MKASKFSDAQKVFILKQGDDGVPVAEIFRKAGISQATYFNWRKKYAGPLPAEMRRLKALEEQTTALSRRLPRLQFTPVEPRALRKAVFSLRAVPIAGVLRSIPGTRRELVQFHPNHARSTAR